MRIQTWGRVIGLTYTSYPRSLPKKARRSRDSVGPPVKGVERNPLDVMSLGSLPTYCHSTNKRITRPPEDQESLSVQRTRIHSIVFKVINST